MSIPGVGSAGPATGSAISEQKAGSPDPAQEFMQFMHETPQQRMEDLWLRAHGITRQQPAAMSPQERQKILNQMKQDIERQVKQAVEDKFYKSIGASAT